jgi:formate dehydrogenase iron-sulfur subunit
MDKCTFCAGGPEEDHSEAERQKYGANRIAEGKLPMCAELCSTKALLAGDAQVISDIFRERVAYRGAKDAAWGNGDVLFHDASKLNKQGGAA